MDSTSDQDSAIGAGDRTFGFGRVRGFIGVSYGTESKRTESRAGGPGRGGAGNFFLVALYLLTLRFYRFFVSGLRWHGPRHTCF